ncbi:peptidyl-prolyl cis-trans isomerase A (cyclophilin A) [Nocardiopsis sp. Huas11]|uniref:peptidylprolyl isomerase n=1 Tax=Nocardiopsis sp. Huas11 TaxID=2183912 RepID=UPI000EADED1F|nr:peptidylprolyl isomerase [Nocardiopsis sp. Huas11]RKS05399.1 peptidyl-prolyl cis-trans isomerase A (cyclophilin A) [Nocardiopsis sp. Huas11]
MNRLTLTASALVACTALFATTACGGEAEAGPDRDAADGAEDAPEQTSEANDDAGGPADIDVSDVEGATLHTSEGDIELVLLPEEAPLTVANFVGLAEGEGVPNPETGNEAFYDGLVFHRVIDGFMIQGGDPLGTGRGGPGYQFEDEVDNGQTFAEPGMLAMANSGPDTNGSQFFITVAPTEHLDGDHTIFGHVADEASQEVVDAIAQVETDPSTARPLDDVVIESVSVQRS